VKIGGGLNYVTGPMGAGKSLYATRQIIAALCSGKHVVTNVELIDNWPERVSRHYWWYRGRRFRRDVEHKLRDRYVYERELATAINYRVRGSGEGRALFVWDEGHNDLNNRNWRDDGRAEILAWATQLRKLGFVGFLLSQHGDNTDAALRRVCNFQVRLQNQREQHRVFGMRMTPWPLFLAFWYPAHLGTTGQRVQPVKLERFMLSWHRHLYDTFGLYHGLAEGDQLGDGLVWLPRAYGVDAPASPRSAEPATASEVVVA
jgi:hypothetical protein